MSKVINWGILGAANFARQHMGPAIHAAKGARLAALGTSSPGKAQGFLDFAPDLKVHESYDALLGDPDIDVVYIPLPNHLHVEWAHKAIAAGKHVLIEKPVAMAADEIDDLIMARDKAGVVAAEAYMIVHHPQWQRAKALVEEDAIGKLVHVDGAFSYFNDDPTNIRNQADAGGGGIRDIGVYTYGSAMYVTGQEPENITHANITWENDVDVIAHVAADFPGFTYTAYTSTRMAVRQEMVFHGEEGVLRISAPFNAELYAEPKVELYRPNTTDVIERFTGVNQYVNQVENFGHSVRTGDPYAWTLEDARKTQRMIDMVFAAA